MDLRYPLSKYHEKGHILPISLSSFTNLLYSYESSKTLPEGSFTEIDTADSKTEFVKKSNGRVCEENKTTRW